MKKVTVPTAGIVAADILREELLTRPDGEYFGSEAELVEKLGISIPTFRQTVRLLEHEQLLSAKRGVGGGYFVRRPDPDSVAHLAAVVLRCNDVSSLDMLEVLGGLWSVSARRAMSCEEPALRAALEEFALPVRGQGEAPRAAYLARKEGRHAVSQLVAKMSGSAVVKLFMSIIREVGHVQSEYYVFNSDERGVEMAQIYMRLARAILDRNEPQVAHLSAAVAEQMMEWRQEDIARGNVSRFEAPDDRRGTWVPTKRKRGDPKTSR